MPEIKDALRPEASTIVGFMMQGLNFGYPACCVTFFTHQYFNEQATRDAHFEKIPAAYENTGFIPCPVCCGIEPQVVEDYINTRRTHPEPFRCAPSPPTP